MGSMAMNEKDYPPEYMDAFSGDELLATAVIFMVLEIVFATVRVWTKERQEMERGLDDWFIWPALVVNIILCIEGLILIPLAGVGTHLVAVESRSPEKLVAWSKGIYACVWLWALAVALPKISIVGFYLRFFKAPYERAISYTLILVIAATFVATGLTATFECSPIHYQWDKNIAGGGTCIDVLAFYRWMSFPNIVTDAIMLILPLPMVCRLHTTRSQKVGLGIIFATGGAGIITSCLRFAIFYNHDAFQDNTWTSVQLLKWTDIEPGIYFLAACMPSFRPLLQRAWSRFMSPYLKSSRNGGSTDPSERGGIALYTIGGSSREHKYARRSHNRTLELLSEVDGDEPNEVKQDDRRTLLTRMAFGNVASSKRQGSPFLSNGGIQVTKTVAIDRC
ncbi:hypothetical protein ETB97_012211 [Aspergillus alliaceus]|uniref:Rhodopsin domain-containing protein n=1 Tax=Petromyces alliaceus TaxID=209559 RepID=A0A8H6E782_PETAA|nr:hypothetical protein ETB97_012211 [Aspergillus burnettii]